MIESQRKMKENKRNTGNTSIEIVEYALKETGGLNENRKGVRWLAFEMHIRID